MVPHSILIHSLMTLSTRMLKRRTGLSLRMWHIVPLPDTPTKHVPKGCRGTPLYPKIQSFAEVYEDPKEGSLLQVDIVPGQLHLYYCCPSHQCRLSCSRTKSNCGSKIFSMMFQMGSSNMMPLQLSPHFGIDTVITFAIETSWACCWASFLSLLMS